MSDVQPLVDIDSLATRLGVTVRWVRRQVAQRSIPFIKLGHLIRFDPDEIEKWLTASRVTANGKPSEDSVAG